MMPGWPELLLVLVIVLVVFGAGKLPQVFEAMGDGVKRFRDAQEGLDSDSPAAEKPKLTDRTPSESGGGVSDATEIERKQAAE